jgi:hypothetical protein
VFCPRWLILLTLLSLATLSLPCSCPLRITLTPFDRPPLAAQKNTGRHSPQVNKADQLQFQRFIQKNRPDPGELTGSLSFLLFVGCSIYPFVPGYCRLMHYFHAAVVPAVAQSQRHRSTPLDEVCDPNCPRA